MLFKSKNCDTEQHNYILEGAICRGTSIDSHERVLFLINFYETIVIIGKKNAK